MGAVGANAVDEVETAVSGGNAAVGVGATWFALEVDAAGACAGALAAGSDTAGAWAKLISEAATTRHIAIIVINVPRNRRINSSV